MPSSVGQLCNEKKVGVDELAARSGLEPARVLAIAAGRWTPSPAERHRIAEALGATVDEIAWGHVTPIQHLYGHGPG